MTPDQLEELAIFNFERAHRLVSSGNFHKGQEAEAQIYATIGVGYATLAASAWKVWIAENRWSIEYGGSL